VDQVLLRAFGTSAELLARRSVCIGPQPQFEEAADSGRDRQPVVVGVPVNRALEVSGNSGVQDLGRSHAA
jgi:hypothetical protein